MSIFRIRTLREAYAAPMVIQLDSAEHGDFASQTAAYLDTLLPEKPCTLLAADARDWNADYSPWPMASFRSGETFAGGGEQTLADLCAALSDIKQKYTPAAVYIAGYSLAGLFALWSLYACGMLDGCACCSGSLWFEGFTDFVKERRVMRSAAVYLSLGGKEEKAPDPLLAAIGIRTREMNTLLEQDMNVNRHTLVMNHGGHFTQPEKRVGDGIAWLLMNQ